jgi:molecular chaperone GrpE
MNTLVRSFSRRLPGVVGFSRPSSFASRSFFGSSQREPVEENPAPKQDSEKSADSAQSAEPVAAADPVPSVEDQQQLAELAEKISDLKDKLKVAAQDAEQATKRHHAALEDAAKYAHTKMAKAVLELADNLRRVHEAVAPEALAADPKVAEIISDVRRVETSLTKALAEFGVREETPLGKKFDPNFHEAMFELPLPHHEPGTVAHVLQTGWLIHDRVLRPARVGVSK